MECCYEKVKQGFRECADPFCRHTAISHSNKQKGSAAMKLSEDLENVAAVGDNMLATICSSPKVREEAIVAMTMVLQSKLYALQGDKPKAVLLAEDVIFPRYGITAEGPVCIYKDDEKLMKVEKDFKRVYYNKEKIGGWPPHTNLLYVCRE